MTGAPDDCGDFAFWLACHGLERDSVHELLAEHAELLGRWLNRAELETYLDTAFARLANEDIDTPERLSDLANVWHAREMRRLRAIYGPRWPRVMDWLDDYVREEIRSRLVEYGFRTRP